MSTSPGSDPPTILGATLEAAMNDLTSLVYDSHVTEFLRPRQLTTHFHLDGPAGTGRAAGVAMFKSLKHAGVEWDSAAICDWATRRGWVVKDVTLLREFGDGIRSGARFHTDPVPWHRSILESWLRGESTRRTTRALQYMACCHRDEPPPTRAEKKARSTARFTALGRLTDGSALGPEPQGS